MRLAAPVILGCLLLSIVAVFAADDVDKDVIFTADKCNRTDAKQQLFAVVDQPTKYRQCGPMGYYWIVECAHGTIFSQTQSACVKPSTVRRRQRLQHRYRTALHLSSDECILDGACRLSADDQLLFCTHNDQSDGYYLQCSPLKADGRGQWIERKCPDTLVFVDDRCDTFSTTTTATLQQQHVKQATEIVQELETTTYSTTTVTSKQQPTPLFPLLDPTIIERRVAKLFHNVPPIDKTPTPPIANDDVLLDARFSDKLAAIVRDLGSAHSWNRLILGLPAPGQMVTTVSPADLDAFSRDLETVARHIDSSINDPSLLSSVLNSGNGLLRSWMRNNIAPNNANNHRHQIMPQCVVRGQVSADSTDSSAFYVCLRQQPNSGDGDQLRAVRMHCPLGETFNRHRSVCQ